MSKTIKMAGHDLDVIIDDYGYARVKYPANHPYVIAARKEDRERKAGGSLYRTVEPHFPIPTPSKTGLPARHDVVGRFLAGLPGGSGNFTTNGYTISSYRWILARRDSSGDILWDDHMWEHPYSPTTSGHIDAVRRDVRLFGRIANRKQFPERIKREIVKMMVSACVGHKTVDEFRSYVYSVVAYGVGAPIAACFTQARGEVAKHFRRERANARGNRSMMRRYYTDESIDALVAYFGTCAEVYPGLMDEYKKRWFKQYNEKMPPIPTRRMPKRPELVRRVISLAGVERTAKSGILGWHFLSNGRYLRFEREPRRVEVGQVLDCPTEATDQGITLCNYGLHASRHIDEARGFFRGEWLCRTLQWGVIDEGANKVAAEFRQCLGMVYLGSEWGDDQSADARALRQAMNSSNEEAERMALKIMGLTATQRTPSAAQLANPPYEREEVAS